jgi:hypothetical protein
MNTDTKLNLASKKGYQPRSNLVKDERGDLLADPHKIVNRWKNYFCQLLNVLVADGVKQIETRTSEPFAPEPEVKVVVGKFKSISRQVLIGFQQN